MARALASSTPLIGSIPTFATFSGDSWATCSISMPPATLAMQRKLRFARSSRYEK
jgi:hypothetical protein